MLASDGKVVISTELDMHTYISHLKTYLASHRPKYGDDNTHSLLEFLWRTYTEYNPINSQAIKDHFASLRTTFNKLSADGADCLFDTVCSLCAEHERLAFSEGIRVGMRLTVELYALESEPKEE